MECKEELGVVPPDVVFDVAAQLQALAGALEAPRGKTPGLREKQDAAVASELRKVRSMAERWREYLLKAHPHALRRAK